MQINKELSITLTHACAPRPCYCTRSLLYTQFVLALTERTSNLHGCFQTIIIDFISSRNFLSRYRCNQILAFRENTGNRLNKPYVWLEIQYRTSAHVGRTNDRCSRIQLLYQMLADRSIRIPKTMKCANPWEVSWQKTWAITGTNCD